MSASAPDQLSSSSPTHRYRWWVGGLLLFAFAVRLLAWLPFAPVEDLRGDESYYVRMAESIAAGEGHPGSFRPPLYPTLMAVVLRLGGGLDAIRLVQILLSTALVAGVYDLARRRFGPAAGLAAGLACALQPALVHYSHFLWSEGLAAALLVLTLWLLERWRTSRQRGFLLAAGAALGLTALTKEVWLFFTAVGALWVVWQLAPGSDRLSFRQIPQTLRAGLRQGWKPALLFCAAAAAVVLPWTVRNTAVHGAPVVISTCRWMPIAVGNLLPEDDWLLGDGLGGPLRKAAPEGMSELEAEAYWRQIALESIGAEQPAWLFKKLARNNVRLWSVHSQTVRFVENEWIPGLSRSTAVVLLSTEVGLYLLLMVAALAGLWLVPDPHFKPLMLAALLLTIGVHVLANAIPRFHVPILPLLMLYAGALLGALSGSVGLLSRAQRWRWAGAAATVGLFLLLVAAGWQRSMEPAFKALEKL
ncbi:MAG: glycosyltransferase family 39 protein [Acidobacteriota bacterium]|nr:glycosyltransferase family 39 protein [Acidobacteriota bacterium]